MKLEIIAMTLREANTYVEQNHRHHGKVAGHKGGRMTMEAWTELERMADSGRDHRL